MNGRDKIFGAIRSRLHRTVDVEEARAAIAERVKTKRAESRAVASQDELITRFRTLLSEGGSGSAECSADELGTQIEEYLRGRQISPEVVVAPADAIERYKLDSSALQMRTGAMRKDDRTSITEAISGVAETGSVLLASSPQFPALASFIVQTHIVLVKRESIVASLEDSWDELRHRHVRVPRHCVWVTGASSTGDIDMRLVIGAQGPRMLQIFIVD